MGQDVGLLMVGAGVGGVAGTVQADERTVESVGDVEGTGVAADLDGAAVNQGE